jgi:hypothetical protein
MGYNDDWPLRFGSGVPGDIAPHGCVYFDAKNGYAGYVYDALTGLWNAISAFGQGIPPAVVAWAPTLAAAKVLYPPGLPMRDGQPIYVDARLVAGDGYGGTFLYRAGDNTPSFSRDAVGFIDAAGRRWFREYSGLLNVKWFGATGNGATDDWAALDACWNYAISTSQNGIFAPVGLYALSQALNINNASLTGASEVGTAFIGNSNAAASVLYLDSTRAGGGGTDASYKNFRIIGNRANLVTPVAGLRLFGNVLYCTFENIRIEETRGPGVLLDGDLAAPGGPFRPTVLTFTNVHVGGCNTHGWHFKAGRNIDLIDCASEGIGGDGVHFSGETESLSKIGNSRMYLENIAGDGIFLGDGDEFRTISPLVGGYGSSGFPCYGYRVDGAVATINTYLFGGQFEKNAAPNASSRDFRFASGDIHTIENGYIVAGQIQIAGQRTVMIRGNRLINPVSNIPCMFTNQEGPLNPGTTTFLLPWSGAQSTNEPALRQFLTGYLKLSGFRAEVNSVIGAGQTITAQVWNDGAGTSFLASLTDAGGGTYAEYSQMLMALTNSTLSLRVTVPAGANAVPINGFHATIGICV